MQATYNINDIHRYANKEFNEQEQRNFEQYLRANPDFAQEVEMVLFGIARQRYQQIEEMRNRYASSSAVPTKVRKITWQRSLQIAAMLVLFIGIAWFGNTYFQTSSLQQMALNQWQNSELPSTQNLRMSNDNAASDQTKTLNAILQYINQKQYQNALDLLTTLPPNAQVLELQGICYTDLKQYDAGISSFKTLIESPNADNKDVVRWRLALTYLLNQQIAEAKEVLQQIINKQEPHSDDAAKLLKKLP